MIYLDMGYKTGSWQEALHSRIRCHNFDKFGHDAKFEMLAAAQRAVQIAEELGIGPALAHRFTKENKFLNLDAARATQLRGLKNALGVSHEEGIDIAMFGGANTQLRIPASSLAKTILHEFAHEIDLHGGKNAKRFSQTRGFQDAHGKDNFHFNFLARAHNAVGPNGILNYNSLKAEYANLAAEHNASLKTLKSHVLRFITKKEWRKDFAYNPLRMPNTLDEYIETLPNPHHFKELFCKENSHKLAYLLDPSMHDYVAGYHHDFVKSGTYSSYTSPRRFVEAFAQIYGKMASKEDAALLDFYCPHTKDYFKHTIDTHIGYLNYEANRDNPKYSEYQPIATPRIEEHLPRPVGISQNPATRTIALHFNRKSTEWEVTTYLSSHGIPSGAYTISPTRNAKTAEIHTTVATEYRDIGDRLLQVAAQQVPPNNWDLPQEKFQQAYTYAGGSAGVARGSGRHV